LPPEIAARIVDEIARREDQEFEPADAGSYIQDPMATHDIILPVRSPKVGGFLGSLETRCQMKENLGLELFHKSEIRFRQIDDPFRDGSGEGRG
jgi:hypothetical protein